MVKSLFLEFRSQAGCFRLTADASGRICRLERIAALATHSADTPAPVLLRAKKRLAGFLSGRKGVDAHKGLNFALDGTALQKKVWRELSRIPKGQTISYAELSRRVGKPRAVRAVASAVGANPVPMLIPCHRVIRSDGSIGGYAYGLKMKKFLLSLER